MKARVAASIVLAFGLTLGMSGCTLVTVQDTLYVKETSVGVPGSVGQIDIRNAVLVTDGDDGTTGNLVASFVNNEGKPHRVQVVHGSTSEYVTVPAYGVKKIGGAGETRVQFKRLGAKPGALTDVYFTYATETGTRLQVPVLSSTFPGLSDYAPAR